MVGIDFFGGGGGKQEGKLDGFSRGFVVRQTQRDPVQMSKSESERICAATETTNKRLNGVLYLSFFRKPYAVTLNQTVSVSNNRVRRCCRCDERFLTATVSLCLVYVWGVCDKRQLPFSVQQ